MDHAAEPGRETLAVPSAELPVGVDAVDDGGFNVGLALLLFAVVVLVCIQNVWLRRRAEREGTAREGEGT